MRKIAWSDRRDKHATETARAQIGITGIIGKTGNKRRPRAERGANANKSSAKGDYREVSFNDQIQRPAAGGFAAMIR